MARKRKSRAAASDNAAPTFTPADAPAAVADAPASEAKTVKLACNVTHWKVDEVGSGGDLTAHVSGLWERCPACLGSGRDDRLSRATGQNVACARCHAKGYVDVRPPEPVADDDESEDTDA